LGFCFGKWGGLINKKKKKTGGAFGPEKRAPAKGGDPEPKRDAQEKGERGGHVSGGEKKNKNFRTSFLGPFFWVRGGKRALAAAGGIFWGFGGGGAGGGGGRGAGDRGGGGGRGGFSFGPREEGPPHLYFGKNNKKPLRGGKS